MTGSPEAIRFLKLLRLEFIMASVLGLFYTLFNGGSYTHLAKCIPPGENKPHASSDLASCTHTNTSRQHIFDQEVSLSCTCNSQHKHVHILHFISLFPAAHTQVHTLHRSQRMGVRHPPQRKLKVSACSAQPNHKSCQSTLVSADAHIYCMDTRTCWLLLSLVWVWQQERRDLGIIMEPHFFLFFSFSSLSTCCFS